MRIACRQTLAFCAFLFQYSRKRYVAGRQARFAVAAHIGYETLDRNAAGRRRAYFLLEKHLLFVFDDFHTEHMVHTLYLVVAGLFGFALKLSAVERIEGKGSGYGTALVYELRINSPTVLNVGGKDDFVFAFFDFANLRSPFDRVLRPDGCRKAAKQQQPKRFHACKKWWFWYEQN